MVLFEIPSGYFADKFGYRLSMILSSIAGTLGFFIYWAIPSYLGFAIGEIILALGAGFMSGARDALLYDTLAHFKQTALYTKWQGRQMTIGTFSEATAAIAAGMVASLSSVSTVLLVQWLVILASVPMAFALRDMRPVKPQQSSTLSKILHGSFIENATLRWLTLYAGVISASTLTMVWFVQPYWQLLEIDVLYFGYLWAGFNIIVGLGSLVAHKVEQWMRFRTLFIAFALSVPLLYLGAAYINTLYVSLLVVAGFWLLRGISTPIIQDYVQRECKDGERATVLSVSALTSRLIFSIFSPFLGWIGDIWSLETALMASGAVFGTLSLIAILGLLATWRAPRAA